MKKIKLLIFIVFALISFTYGQANNKENISSTELTNQIVDFKQIFPLGDKNDAYAEYFTGQSYLSLLTLEGVPSFNVTFEPGSRTFWHIHQSKNNGGQFLMCTAGEGWYQEEGKKPVSLSAGSLIYIPAGVKHWHGAKKDSWFSHIALAIPGDDTENVWLEAVSDEDYDKLSEADNEDYYTGDKITFSSKKEFKKINMFGTGMKNFMMSKYFSGKSFIKMMAMPGKTSLFMANVTFEPGCRNNWHIHHGSGQILYCTAGTGWYQEEGKAAQLLKPGDVVYIPAEVKHWHGATKDSWFSHIALAEPAEEHTNEWLEAVTDEIYNQLN